MGKTEQAVFSCLPSGVYQSNGLGVRIRMIISPRLMERGELRDYDDFVNWPLVVRDKLSFDFQFWDGKGPIGESVLSRQQLGEHGDNFLTPDPKLWTVLLPPDTRVNEYRFSDLTDKKVVSADSSAVESLALTYLAEALTVAPSAVESETLPSLAELATSDHVFEELERELGRDGVFAPREGTRALHQLQALQTPQLLGRKASESAAASALADTTDKPLDFHELVATLGNYPHVLGYLGLVAEHHLRPDTAAKVAAYSPQGYVRVLVSRHDNINRPPISPWTAYRLNLESPFPIFLPRAKHVDGGTSGEVDYGLLQLATKTDDKPAYEAVQTDVNKFAQDMLAYQRSSREGVRPALKQGGIALARRGAGDQLKTNLERAKNLHGEASPASSDSLSGSPRLYADDVTRGFFVDVAWGKKGPQNWKSLCERQRQYVLPPAYDGPCNDPNYLVEEGLITRAVTRTPAHGDDRLLCSDCLFRWDGWSLAISRPGFKTENKVYNVHLRGSNRVRANYKPYEKSLLPLRFEEQYWFRLRAVDLSGYALNRFEVTALLDAVDGLRERTELKAKRPYARLEPVTAPMIVSLDPSDKYRLASQLVVRSFWRASSKDSDSDDNSFEPTEERHYVVSAPEIAGALYELHHQSGLDDGSAEAAFEILTRTGPWLKSMRGCERLQRPGSELPYVPDPLATGAAYRGLSPGGGRDMSRTQPFASGRHKLIVSPCLGGVEDLPGDDRRIGGFRIKLPLGESREVELSSYVTDPGPFELESLLGSDGANAAAGAMARGTEPMLTPARKVSFIHAVQKPLSFECAPMEIAERAPGGTFAAVNSNARLHRGSTSKLEVLAQWDEMLETGMVASRKSQVLMSAVAEEPAADSDPSSAPLLFTHEFGDTKYREIRYTVRATSRYVEYFPEYRNAPDAFCREAPAQSLKLLSTRRPEPPDLVRVVPLFNWTSDPKAQALVRTRTAAAFRIYVSAPWYSSGAGEKLAIVLSGPAQPSGPSIDMLHLYSSLWGTDPVWQPGARLTALDQSDFTGALTKPEHAYRVPGLQADQNIVAYDPAVGEGDGCLIFDVQLSPASTIYSGFVRFALARWQKDSLADLHLSEIVLTDVLPVLPPRTVQYEWKTDGAKRQLTKLQLEGPGVSSSDVFPKTAARFEIEHFTEGYWSPYAPGRLERKGNSDTKVCYTNDEPIELPGERARILIVETEEHRTLDDANAASGERPVFADSLEIP